MKRVVFLLALVLGFATITVCQVPRKISYQGLLANMGGAPATDGTYGMAFGIYDSSAGEPPLWFEVQNNVAVTKGSFHVLLGSVSPLSLPFDRTYYVEMTIISGPGVTSSATIAPRTELTSSPYALRSDSATYAKASAPSGDAGGSLAGAYPNPALALNAVTSANVADASLQGADLGADQVVKSINGMRDAVHVRGEGGAIVTSSGDSLIITATGGGGGTGIQGVQSTNNTLDILNPAGPTATVNLKLPFSATTATSEATFGVANLSTGLALSGLSTAGVGVLGGSADAAQFGVWGVNTGGGYGVGGSSGGLTTAGVWGANSGLGVGVLGTSLNGVAVKGSMTGTGAAGFFEINNAGSSNTALRTATNGTGSAFFATGRGKTFSNATMRIENTQTDQGMAAYVFNNSNFATAHVQNNGSGQILWIEHHGTGDYIVATNGSEWKFWVDNAGVTHTKVLEIMGGSDLSERFEIADAGVGIEPGMVVSIDPHREGQLTPSREPYDRKVAGIVSGAGGVHPGMLMGQAGSAVADGSHPVALSGRVYCKVTAANGPVLPGDLLTTSSLPGHAMRVDDHGRAPGSIIGKAMSRLEKGTGLVLVLVNLQ